MYVPQVDVFVCDLHGALAIDVQVRGGHQVHVETLWQKKILGRNADGNIPILSHI